MCGFAGVFCPDSSMIIDKNQLFEMGSKIESRGPDDFGLYTNGGIGLSFRRLSILDVSSNGHQPMTSIDGRYTIVFNGEIYNFKEFYPELKAKNYQFHSNSDSEVLLYLFIEYGPAILNRLNGMFSFCIYDVVKHEIFLARDRFGVKPLYYSIDGEKVIFGSEPKSLSIGGASFQLNKNKLNEWLMFRYVSGDETLNSNVKKILPGHYMVISRKSNQITRWYNLKDAVLNHSGISDPNSWFIETLTSAIDYRMVSDVPVGLLLSGGLDSSSIAAILNKSGYSGINAFNVGFNGFKYDESAIAERLSMDLGFNFHSKQFRGEKLRDAIIQSTIALDEPIMHANEPQIYAISKVARDHVKVLLSGEGADELLSGYIRYKALESPFLGKSLSLLLSIIPDNFKSSRMRKIESFFQVSSSTHKVLYNSLNYFENDLSYIISSELSVDLSYRLKVLNEGKELFPNSLLRQASYLDQHTYLQSLNDRNDRTTMRASIECREPFQDFRLVEGIFSIDKSYLYKNGKGKNILREAMKGILPDYVLNFKKIGFVAPFKEYISEDPIMRESFATFKNSPIFELELLNKIKKDLLFNDPKFYQLKQQLWFLHLWFKSQNNEPIF